MHTAKLLAFLLFLIAPFAARAATCPAGSWLNTTGCEQCINPYYCPGDDNRYKCSPLISYDPDVPIYYSYPGATECKPCKIHTGDRTNFKFYKNGEENHILQDAYTHNCRAEFAGVSEHGEFRFSCYYAADSDYTTSGTGDNHKCLVTIARCDAGYAAIDTGWNQYKIIDEGLRIWVHTYEMAVADQCQPAPTGHYAGANDLLPVACPAGTSTHTTGATSVDACRPLCAAGATQFHAGDLSFNLWPNNECASPALRVGIGGDVCCVNLESGTTTGAVHVQYGGNTYHTVN